MLTSMGAATCVTHHRDNDCFPFRYHMYDVSVVCERRSSGSCVANHTQASPN